MHVNIFLDLFLLVKMSLRCNGTLNLLNSLLYDFCLEIYLAKVTCVSIRLQIKFVLQTNLYQH
jgi:hypothetical protein